MPMPVSAPFITIAECLDALLLPKGFRRVKPAPVYERVEAGFRQTVGVRKSRTAHDEYAIHFSMHMSPECVERSYELSPIAPLKNTYWWPKRLTESDAAALRTQVEQVALAYFHALPERFDANAAEASLHSRLTALTTADPPFASTGRTYWRRRGPMIDIVDLELLAEGRFAFVYLAAWHSALTAGIDEPLPDGVTRAASRTVGVGAVDCEPNTTLFYLGPPYAGVARVEDADIAAVALRYFESIDTVDDVLQHVRPEYRHHFGAPGVAT